MVKLKTVLDTRRAKADGTYNILLRVTHHKDVKYLPMGIAIKQHQWDEKAALLNKNHPNGGTINASITKQFYEVQKAIINLENEYSFDKLKKILNPEIVATPITPTFKEFAESVMGSMKLVKRTGGALVYLTAVNRLIEYCGNPKISFIAIDYTFLDKFKNSLIEDGLKPNSVGNYFRSIRALYNKAIKAKVVARELYPFHDIPIKTEKTAKRAIKTKELIQIYQHLKKVNTPEWHAANYFFLSFTLRGISFTDLAYLKHGNIKDDYIVYRRRKTKKLYSIKLHPIARSLLNLYPGCNNGYLLPIFPKEVVEDSEETTKITRQWIKTTNKYLNRIAVAANVSGNITTYVIRHTWATLAKRLGYANEMIAEAMGHEYGNKITNIYLDEFDQSVIDDMNDKIILSIIPCTK